MPTEGGGWPPPRRVSTALVATDLARPGRHRATVIAARFRHAVYSSSMGATFTCQSCGSTDFEQVVVRLPGGMLRQTDLFCCRACRTVYFDPKTFHAGHPAGQTAMAPDLKTYGI